MHSTLVVYDCDFKKKYICEYVDSLKHDDKLTMLKMVYKSPYRDKLDEKGTGVQIKLDDLSDSLISDIYFYMLTRININISELASMGLKPF